MRVRATERGYYGTVLREIGYEFELTTDEHFHASWMEKVSEGSSKPGKTQKHSAVGVRPEPVDEDTVAARIAAADLMTASAKREDARNKDVI